MTDEKQLSPIETLACWVVDQHRDDGYPGDVDGGALQDKMVDLGILRPVRVTEACCDTSDEHADCPCAEFGFPTDCLRLAPDMHKLLSVYRAENEIGHSIRRD